MEWNELGDVLLGNIFSGEYLVYLIICIVIVI